MATLGRNLGCSMRCSCPQTVVQSRSKRFKGSWVYSPKLITAGADPRWPSTCIRASLTSKRWYCTRRLHGPERQWWPSLWRACCSSYFAKTISIQFQNEVHSGIQSASGTVESSDSSPTLCLSSTTPMVDLYSTRLIRTNIGRDRCADYCCAKRHPVIRIDFTLPACCRWRSPC